MDENFSKKTQSVIILLIIFAVMLELNNLMPLHRDDYDYSMIWDTGEHLNSLRDVAESTYIHYFEHGGRAVTVFCLNLFLWLGKFAFDIANALMFTALIVLIYLHARREIKFDEPKILATAGILAWLCIPHFGEVAVWKSGSTVYLWSAVPVALFLLPYNLNLAGNKNFGNSKIFLIGIFFLGIIAGCSVENLAVTVTVLSAAISFYAHNQKFFQSWMLAGTFGNILGVAILLAAPGNYVRYDIQSADKGFLIHIGNQFAGNGEMLIYILPIVLLLVCLFKGGENSSKSAHTKLLIVAGILIVSYFCDSFLARTFKDSMIEFVLPQFHASEKFIDHFDNFIMKSEEMIIYALILFWIFFRVKNSLQFRNNIALIDFPYSIFLFLLAIFNNFVMIAAPTFPARATFSAVTMILIGTLAILRSREVQENLFFGNTGKFLKYGAGILTGFTLLSTIFVTFNLRVENDNRLTIIRDAISKKIYFVNFPPLETKNRAIRHVFFADFDNGVTKEGLCEFYGIEDIHVRDLKRSERKYFEQLQAPEIDTNLFSGNNYGLWRKREN